MTRAFNFSAGPSALPTEVLEEAAAELLDYRGKGTVGDGNEPPQSPSSSKLPKRRKRISANCSACPDDYAVLFLQGGATAQFAAVPLNLLGEQGQRRLRQHRCVGEKSDQRGEAVLPRQIVAASEATNFDRVPPRADWRLDPNAAYVHIISNETIGGVEYFDDPDVGSTPLVADMSSTLLSRPIDVTRLARSMPVRRRISVRPDWYW